jgi:predicted MPP superfamily phosphohydrolase
VAVFFFLSLAVVCTLHYLLYVSGVQFLALTHPVARRALFWLLILLGISFIPSAVLMRVWPGRLSGVFYFATAFWVGLFIYLLLAAIFSWLVFISGKLTGFSPDMRTVFTLACLLAVGVAVFGTFRAMYPVLKPVDITLKGLPEAWRGKTLVQLSDVHLGTIRGPKFLEQIIEKVNSVRPELILITGDLFDGVSAGNMSDFTSALGRLRAARGVFFVTGNHEGYLGTETPLAILSKTGIRILEHEVVDIDGLQIIGIPFPEHNRPNDVRSLLTESRVYDAEKPGILLYHTPTSIDTNHTDRRSQQTGTYWRPDTDMTAARSMGIDLQLSGHSHGGQFFPFTLLTGFIFSGYDYGLHREGDFQIYITRGAGTWGPPMRVGCPPEIPVIRLQ